MRLAGGRPKPDLESCGAIPLPLASWLFVCLDSRTTRRVTVTCHHCHCSAFTLAAATQASQLHHGYRRVDDVVDEAKVNQMLAERMQVGAGRARCGWHPA